MFSIHYKKNNNSELFRDISNTKLLQNAQNYIPIYNLFFNLDENTFNKINLNHKYCINKITNLYSDSSDKYNNVDHLGEYTTKNILLKPFVWMLPIINIRKNALLNIHHY